MSSQKGLGKGFGSLLPSDFDESILLDKKDRTQKLFISEIMPNPEQPRKQFDENALKELSSSIKLYGILQPLVVTPHKDKYFIIAGERRYRAAKMAGIESVPALIRSSEELDRLEIGLVENVQRVDLSPLEQALSIAKLHEQFSKSYDEIALRLGKANTTVINTVRLLQLPDDAKQALADGKISEGHARSILSLKDEPTEQIKLLKLIIQNKWSVRQAEQYASQTKKGQTPTVAKAQVSAKDNKAARDLQAKLGSKTSIARSKRGGRIQIFFGSDKELQDIVSKIIR